MLQPFITLLQIAGEDASTRPPATQHINKLLKAGLIKKKNGKYETTSTGQMALMRIRELIEVIEI